jgi:hypothetical protein
LSDQKLIYMTKTFYKICKLLSKLLEWKGKIDDLLMTSNILEIVNTIMNMIHLALKHIYMSVCVFPFCVCVCVCVWYWGLNLALCLLDKRATTWATLPALFVLIIFEIGSHFIPRLDWTTVNLFVLPSVAGMTGMYHLAQPLVKMESGELFPRLTSNYDRLDLYLLVARITGTSYLFG